MAAVGGARVGLRSNLRPKSGLCRRRVHGRTVLAACYVDCLRADRKTAGLVKPTNPEGGTPSREPDDVLGVWSFMFDGVRWELLVAALLISGTALASVDKKPGLFTNCSNEETPDAVTVRCDGVVGTLRVLPLDVPDATIVELQEKLLETLPEELRKRPSPPLTRQVFDMKSWGGHQRHAGRCACSVVKK